MIALLILIPLADALLAMNQSLWDGVWDLSVPRVAGQIVAPATRTFLSGGTVGHLGQMLMIWLLPLYLLLLTADDYIREYQTGYAVIILSKQTRGQYMRARFGAAFITAFTVILFSLLLNFAIISVAFRGGTRGLEYIAELSNGLLDLESQNLVLTSLIYIMVFALVAGVYAVVCTALCFAWPQYKIVYPAAFLLWFVQILSPYSLTYAIQPFIEYGWGMVVPALAIFVGSALLVIGGVYAYRVKGDAV